MILLLVMRFPHAPRQAAGTARGADKLPEQGASSRYANFGISMKLPA
jgi:hypothetical protein